MKRFFVINWISIFLISFLFVYTFSFKSFGQISQPGIPWSFDYSLHQQTIAKISVEKPDLSKIANEDNHPEKNGGFYRYGVLIKTQIEMQNTGTWKVLENGNKLWQLSIECTGAKALSLHFRNFHLPPGGKLFIYSADKKQVIGAFTEVNNHESGIFATQLIHSEEIILEYNEYLEPLGKVDFTITALGFAYRGISGPAGTKGFGDSDSSCEVNVNCQPEGDNWQDQKRGVVRISLLAAGNMGWCSGSLINNTSNDCTPYILSADHCGGDASASEYLQWIFYFNYVSPDCANPASEGTLASQTMTGCELTAKGGQGGTAGSDFHLLKLIDAIPNDYNPYYNGWNWKNEGAMAGVSIHHPSGDIMKISTFSSLLTTSDWNGSGVDSHWQVTWVATANGHGVTEGGSSGSPIFDSDGLIVGDLTGGSSYCSTPDSPDLYGKFSYSWESNGTLPEEQLKPWLDPINSGDTSIQGRNQCGASGVYADFSWTPVIVVLNQPVNFINESLGNITGYSWIFQNGNPANSTAENPQAVEFTSTGVHQVSLTVTGPAGNDTRIKDINVISPAPPIAGFVASQTQVYTGDTINYFDLTTGGPTNWDWTFIGGNPNSSNQQNPQNIVYNFPGNYTVSLSVSNPYGNHFHTKTNYIEVLPGDPSVIFCDTISNMLPFDLLTVNETLPWGLIPGHNPYNINEYADKYENTTYDFIEGLLVPVHTAQSSMNSAVARFKIWDGDSVPGNVLGYKDIYVTDLIPNSYQFVEFDQDISISGTFFAGYAITYFQTDNYSGPHNVAIHMAEDRGSGGLSTLFVRYNNNWFPSKDLSLVNNLHTSLAIEPVACKISNYPEIITSKDDIKVFPNPCGGIFQIFIPNFVSRVSSLKLYSITGQEIDISYQKHDNHLIKTKINNQESGVYFIHLTVGNETSVKKIFLIK